MNKHTPGPWFAFVDKGQTIIRTSRTSAAFSPLAVVKGDKRDTLKDHEANAKLMASAPDLLEALEYCLDCLGHEFALPADCQSNARAAIARARGEA